MSYTVYSVTVNVKGLGDYVIDVPTFQGPDAAARRARMSVMSMNPKADMDTVTVTNTEVAK